MNPFFILAASILIRNDSPYTLNAELFAPKFVPITKMTLPPNTDIKWNETYQNLSSSLQGPYTVLWTCQSGSEFGISYKVASGTMINAQSASGSRRCNSTEGS